jgi:hypothetical protein
LVFSRTLLTFELSRLVNFAQGPPPPGALSQRSAAKPRHGGKDEVDGSETLDWKTFRPASVYAKRKLVVAENSAVEYTALVRPSTLNR